MKQFEGYASLLQLAESRGGDMSGSVMERYGLTPSHPWFPHPANPLAGSRLPATGIGDALAQISGMLTLLVDLYTKPLCRFLGLDKEEEVKRKRRTSTFRSFWPSLRIHAPELEINGPAAALLATTKPIFQTPLRPQAI
jgi:hypothetical protein